MEPFWQQVAVATLAQGDYLKGCSVPVIGSEFEPENQDQEILVRLYDLIIVTQSCDLEQRKVRLVAACPIYTLTEFEKVNPILAQRGKWEEVRKGRVEGLHLLASMTNPENNRDAFVVDFREIYSLPLHFLERHASKATPRWRLKSPFLEHFSQAFARFFMRVGLPSTIPQFR